MAWELLEEPATAEAPLDPLRTELQFGKDVLKVLLEKKYPYPKETTTQ